MSEIGVRGPDTVRTRLEFCLGPDGPFFAKHCQHNEIYRLTPTGNRSVIGKEPRPHGDHCRQMLGIVGKRFVSCLEKMTSPS